MAERLLYLQVHGWVGKSQRYRGNAVWSQHRPYRTKDFRYGLFVSQTMERAWRTQFTPLNFSRNA